MLENGLPQRIMQFDPKVKGRKERQRNMRINEVRRIVNNRTKTKDDNGDRCIFEILSFE